MNTIRLSARMTNLDLFTGFVTDFLRANDFPGERVRELEMAAEEILVNIIRYAYPEGEPGEVEIRGRTEPGRGIRFEFEDYGTSFDPTSASQPDVDLPLSEREIGGLGIFLVRKMVNEFRYRREGDRNILTFLVRKSRGGS